MLITGRSRTGGPAFELLLVAACVATLAASAVITGRHELAQPNLNDCLADPSGREGTQILVFRESRVSSVFADGSFEVHEKGLGPGARVRVEGIREPVRPGETITVEGTFGRGARLQATRWRVHRNRFGKVWTSLPVVLFVAIRFFRDFRLTPGGVAIR